MTIFFPTCQCRHPEQHFPPFFVGEPIYRRWISLLPLSVQTPPDCVINFRVAHFFISLKCLQTLMVLSMKPAWCNLLSLNLMTNSSGWVWKLCVWKVSSRARRGNLLIWHRCFMPPTTFQPIKYDITHVPLPPSSSSYDSSHSVVSRQLFNNFENFGTISFIFISCLRFFFFLFPFPQAIINMNGT